MKREFRVILYFICFATPILKAYSSVTTTCKASLKNDTLTIENELISRKYLWNGGNIISTSITDKASNYKWKLNNNKPDSFFPGEDKPKNGTFESVEVAQTAISTAYLRVDVTVLFGKLYVKKVFRIYPNSPAIACDYYLKGEFEGSWNTQVKSKGSLQNIETQAAIKTDQVKAMVIERLNLPSKHWKVKAVQFYDITDRNNNLVDEKIQWAYRGESQLAGNILLINNQLQDHGLFILKESPTSEAQLNYPGFDFIVRTGEINVTGIGIDANELNKNQWIRCYGVVTGVFKGDDYEQLSAIRNYQNNIRIHEKQRDNMIMLNTWGDRNQDKSVGEEFTLKEIKAGQKLGISHFQIDDGWQSGKSANSAFAGGSFNKIWDNPSYWLPDEKKFPNGLKPIVEAGKKAGIEVCLWFNPSKEDDYANWQKDAGALIHLYKEYGIRTFKIDGVQVETKLGDVNLRKMFDSVLSATKDVAVFNLDVTAGKRYGYHYFNEYGNIFLENRYTDYGNYYPFWTLRNLWMLSKYVPSQNLQIEFLNNFRNKDKYPNDPLAPAEYSFEYLFAITMMAQPLAWFEASGLPEEAFKISPLVKKYKSIQADIHQGNIFPIGNEPDGKSWTGFQSLNKNKGYIMVYRENNNQTSLNIKTWFKTGTKVSLEAVLGYGKTFNAVSGQNGEINFKLSNPNSYALYRYEIKP
jgi:alpha-galactosidase